LKQINWSDGEHDVSSARLSLAAYDFGTRLLRPVIPLMLSMRTRRGKEDPTRIQERYGIASRARPTGTLVWIHAASVGESLSVLPLIGRLLLARPDLSVLVTTGTLTSAELMQARLPERAMHQFVPLDSPTFCNRFLDHWSPDLAIWVESEFWPNLITSTHARQIPLALVNARITEQSYLGWRKWPALIADLLGRFSTILAQDQASADRLRSLGAKDVFTEGNLKHDALPLPVNEEDLAHLRNVLGSRPVWLAASTHDGEERIIGEAHRRLATHYPDLLTLVVPRHPVRGSTIEAAFEQQGLHVMRRGASDTLSSATKLYVADTLGELGLFYRLAPIVFVGGTLVPHGGHNPLEPARLGCALIAGPSDFNFLDIFTALKSADAVMRVKDAVTLAGAVARLLQNEPERTRYANAARNIASRDTGAAERALNALLPLLPAKTEKAHARA